MNREDGLKLRRNVVRDNTSNSSKENNTEDNKIDQEESLEDGDSKETRFTLMEEVLLLGLKDKEVKSMGVVIWYGKVAYGYLSSITYDMKFVKPYFTVSQTIAQY